MTDLDGFTVAAYHFNGEFIGTAEWPLVDLSTRWLQVCEEILNYYGPIFRHNMGSTLSAYEISFTAGIGYFKVNGMTVFSAVYLPGVIASQDDAVKSVFIEQLSNNDRVLRCCHDISSFRNSLNGHHKRPLCITVDWGNSEIDENDYQAIIQLGTHFAGAYLCRYCRQDKKA